MCSSHTHCTHTTPCTASLHPKPACILPPEPFLHHGCTQASRRDNSGSLLGTHGGFSRDEPVGPPAARLAHSSAPQQCWLYKLPSGAPPGPRPGTSSLPPPAAPPQWVFSETGSDQRFKSHPDLFRLSPPSPPPQAPSRCPFPVSPFPPQPPSEPPSPQTEKLRQLLLWPCLTSLASPHKASLADLSEPGLTSGWEDTPAGGIKSPDLD